MKPTTALAVGLVLALSWALPGCQPATEAAKPGQTGQAVATPTIGPDDPPAKIVSMVCAKCHGPGGSGDSELYPRLASQQQVYLERQLKMFRDKFRSDDHAKAYMWAIAGPLRDTQIQGLAEFFSGQPPMTPTPATDSALAARGKAIFEQGVPSHGVPKCAECHGKDGQGILEIPRLAGQYRPYLYRQMIEFRISARVNKVMHDQTKNVTDEEAMALAEYLAAK